MDSVARLPRGQANSTTKVIAMVQSTMSPKMPLSERVTIGAREALIRTMSQETETFEMPSART